MDPEIALRRGLARKSGEDRFEELGLVFQQKLHTGFRALVQEFPDRCIMVDGNREIETVAAEVQAIAKDRLA